MNYQIFHLQSIAFRGPASSIPNALFFTANLSKELIEKIHSYIIDEGDKAGISFKFRGRVGNSRDANKLVKVARQHGESAEAAAINSICTAYFEQEQEIMKYDTLRSIDIAAGISAELPV